ncbi:DUF45 domain-containing protein [Caloramator sp. mosi_1]|uniref:YgjP-like metallopeptidase domain-containing protein n=1 Tax=Caloramator sp. mosi_1 TaxID=3023090 RepID=UPI0023626A5B|nr:YgjP-like metallopeptidase domain-containing protein [Caloramator sp. mosi_1]WDC85324.1 DUF45 domain-containing protein [Caloramator sp. mosi_1]
MKGIDYERIKLQWTKIDYILIKKRKKTITIKITRKGDVVVTAPIYLEDRYIEEFIKTKAKWILKN